jgi:membrane protein
MRVAARLKRLVKLWVDLFDEHALLDHASAMAFAVLKALVPLTLLGLALLGALGQRHVWNQTVVPGMKSHVQPATLHAIDSAAQRIFSSDSIGLIVFASIVALWYISGSVRAVMSSTNVIYGSKETRSWKVRFPLSFALAAVVAVCVIGAALAVLAAPALARHGALQVVVAIGRWLVAVVLLGVAVAVLVRFAPVATRSKTWVSGGSVLVILAWVATSMIFKLLVTQVLSFKTPAGSLGIFLVLAGYVYTSSIIFLLGVELDELLRQEATAGETGVRQLLGIAR